jgi:hypothetical protein
LILVYRKWLSLIRRATSDGLEVMKMCGPPPDRICIEDVDGELIWSLQVWKEYVSRSQASISESERRNMKSVDCIDWFCALLRGRLEAWRKDGKHSMTLSPKYYLEKEGYLVR